MIGDRLRPDDGGQVLKTYQMKTARLILTSERVYNAVIVAMAGAIAALSIAAVVIVA